MPAYDPAMCGFAGFVDRSGRMQRPDEVLAAMAGAIAHRGPDGEGTFIEPRVGVGIVHRRLAIIDRSPAAAQPMRSPTGRWVVAYNGELWNFRELRQQLELGGTAVGPSPGDTAVLAAALDAHGAEAALPLLDGMFAFAALDMHDRTLWLARDRFGVKPCMWGWADDGRGVPVFGFGSEIRAIAALPCFRNRVSPFGIASALGSLAIPGPRTIYEGVHALQPGHALRMDLDTGRIEHVRWHSVRAAAAAARTRPYTGSREELVRALDGLVTSAVRRRLASDVPVGAFLSGGIDSTLVVAAMQHAGVAGLRTFTAGFEHPEYDERAHARTVADALGTEHHEVLVRDADLVPLVEDAIGCFDQPFADASAVPTLAVSRLARGMVGVVLSGDGGDEFFGGYERHLRGYRLATWSARVPLAVRRRMADAIESVSGDAWDRGLRPFEPFLPAALRRTQRGRLMHKAAGLLRAEDNDGLWRAFFAVWQDPASLVAQLPGDSWRAAVACDMRAIEGELTGDERRFFDELLLRDQTMYLPDDILTKLDRCTMECGLEGREPLLDQRIFELSWRIPPAWRTDGTVGKVLLRDVLARHLPPQARGILARPKAGFGVPLRTWLCGPLRDWCEDALAPRRLNAQGILDPVPLRRAWERCQAGDESAAARTWAACVVSRWLEREGLDAQRVARA